MKSPRTLARIRAYLGGYFWLPCPRCGQMFAGFEMRGTIMNDDGHTGRGTCCPDSAQDEADNAYKIAAAYAREQE